MDFFSFSKLVMIEDITVTEEIGEDELKELSSLKAFNDEESFFKDIDSKESLEYFIARIRKEYHIVLARKGNQSVGYAVGFLNSESSTYHSD